MFDKNNAELQEGLRALSEKYDQVIAERKSLYSIIDKLTGCLEETNRRFDGLIKQVEAFENRMTDLELRVDRIKEDLEDADGRQGNVAGIT